MALPMPAPVPANKNRDEWGSWSPNELTLPLLCVVLRRSLQQIAKKEMLRESRHNKAHVCYCKGWSMTGVKGQHKKGVNTAWASYLGTPWRWSIFVAGGSTFHPQLMLSRISVLQEAHALGFGSAAPLQFTGCLWHPKKPVIKNRTVFPCC